jgi:hypothetical protein
MSFPRPFDHLCPGLPYAMITRWAEVNARALTLERPGNDLSSREKVGRNDPCPYKRTP